MLKKPIVEAGYFPKEIEEKYFGKDNDEKVYSQNLSPEARAKRNANNKDYQKK